MEQQQQQQQQQQQLSQTGRKTGHVKFFDCQKGFGFIIPNEQIEGNPVEIFVHHTSIVNSGGFRSLAEGEEVEYDLIQGGKGLQASNVSGPNGSSVKGDPRGGRNNNYMHNQNNTFNNNNRRNNNYNNFNQRQNFNGYQQGGYQNQQGYQPQNQWGYGYSNQYQRQNNQMPGYSQNNGSYMQQNYPVPQFNMPNVEQ